MAKKIDGYIKLQVKAGEAKPSPPIGPALGQRGVNIMEFCKQFNAATQEVEKGTPLPTVITVFADKSFTFVTKTPPASVVVAMKRHQRALARSLCDAEFEQLLLSSGIVFSLVLFVHIGTSREALLEHSIIRIDLVSNKDRANQCQWHRFTSQTQPRGQLELQALAARWVRVSLSSPVTRTRDFGNWKTYLFNHRDVDVTPDTQRHPRPSQLHTEVRRLRHLTAHLVVHRQLVPNAVPNRSVRCLSPQRVVLVAGRGARVGVTVKDALGFSGLLLRCPVRFTILRCVQLFVVPVVLAKGNETTSLAIGTTSLGVSHRADVLLLQHCVGWLRFQELLCVVVRQHCQTDAANQNITVTAGSQCCTRPGIVATVTLQPAESQVLGNARISFTVTGQCQWRIDSKRCNVVPGT